MIYAHRLSTLLRNELCSSFHSIANRRPINTSPWQSSTTELYSRINPIGDPTVSIVPVLDQWVEEGCSVHRESLKDIVKKLRSSRRFHHALEVSMWMTDKQYYNLTSNDAAVRLGLISKAKGIEQAEKYFNNLAPNLKKINVYGALLHCYETAKCVEKAEAVIQKTRDLGFAMQRLHYNVMLSLYCKAKNVEKLDALLNEMESDPKFVPNWTDYTVAATGYRKAGLLDKVLRMLKEAEACLTSETHISAYFTILKQYAIIGKPDEALRFWSLYKNKCKVKNEGYSCILRCLVKFGDFEMAEEIFYEWESRDDLTYDMSIPNFIIAAYSKKGLIEKAEALIDRAISKGGKPNSWTWYCLVKSYLENEQPEKAVEMMKKAIVNSKPEWKPDMVLVEACLEYLKGVGDSEQIEEFANLLQVKDMDIASSD